jgi:ribosome-associated protein
MAKQPPLPAPTISPVQLATFCVNVADSRKAENIMLLQLSDLTIWSDYILCCTGASEPQIRAISDRIVRETRTQLDIRPVSVDGKPESHWIVIDYGTVVIHVMTPEMRERYQLEQLWGDAPRVDVLAELERIRKDALEQERQQSGNTE